MLDDRIADRQASDGSGLTLWPNATAALDLLGIGGVRRVAREADGMRTSRPDGVVLQHVDAATMDSVCGGNGMAVRRADLLAAMRSAVPDDVEVVGASLLGVLDTGSGPGPVRVDTSVGPFAARVLVGADGARSRVRASLTGGARDLRDTGMRVVRGLSELDLPSRPAEVVMGRGLQFGLFPLRRGTYWFAAYPRRCDLGEAGRSVATLFAAWGAPVPGLVAATPPDSVLTHDVVDRRPPGRIWGRDRVTLAGDAAHLAAPTMGQGTCHAFEDAVELGSTIARGLDAEALRAYEAHRARRVGAMVRSSHAAAVVGQSRSRLLCAVRDLAMRSTPAAVAARQLRSMFTLDVAATR